MTVSTLYRCYHLEVATILVSSERKPFGYRSRGFRRRIEEEEGPAVLLLIFAFVVRVEDWFVGACQWTGFSLCARGLFRDKNQRRRLEEFLVW
jgi:hypothetical protein